MIKSNVDLCKCWSQNTCDLLIYDTKLLLCDHRITSPRPIYTFEWMLRHVIPHSLQLSGNCILIILCNTFQTAHLSFFFTLRQHLGCVVVTACHVHIGILVI